MDEISGLDEFGELYNSSELGDLVEFGDQVDLTSLDLFKDFSWFHKVKVKSDIADELGDLDEFVERMKLDEP